MVGPRPKFDYTLTSESRRPAVDGALGLTRTAVTLASQCLPRLGTVNSPVEYDWRARSYGGGFGPERGRRALLLSRCDGQEVSRGAGS